MNFLKNFGTGGTNMNMGSQSIGGKSNYFSSLKLDQGEGEKKKTKTQSKSQKKKGPPLDFIPHKFALNFDPPGIIFEYKDPSNDKLYHHKMNLTKLKKETPARQALEYLKKKHQAYFTPKVIDEPQIQKLIEKLKANLNENKSQMEDVEEEDDLDFDYDDDFDDL